MDVQFCLDAGQEAIDSCEVPEIFSTDQGSQLTSLVFTELLKAYGIRSSMDGKVSLELYLASIIPGGHTRDLTA